MGRNSLTLGVLLCLLPVVVCGQARPPLVAEWEFPRAYTPPPDAFLLIEAQNVTSLKQFRVPPSAEGACPVDKDTTPNTFCAVVTPCPAAGSLVAYWVYAQWGERLSDPSNVMVCLFTRDKPCVCQDPLEVQPPAPLRPLTQLLTPPPPPAPQAPQSPQSTQPESPSTEVLVNAPPAQLSNAPPTSLVAAPPAVLAPAVPTQVAFQIPAAPAGAGT